MVKKMRSISLLLSVSALLLGTGSLVQAAEAFDGNVILGRPTDTTMSVSVMGFSDQDVYVEYGHGSDNYDETTSVESLQVNDPHVFELTGLDPDAGYSYRLRFRQGGEGDFLDSESADFHTARPKGSEFTFAVEADSHMGAMTRQQKWCDTCGRELADDVTMANTMANMVTYNPDFLVDLGDTFMTSQNFGNGLFEIQNRQRGAPIREEDAVGDYLLLRGHLSQSAFTVPLFLVLGNHDAERRSRLDGTPDSLGVWANNSRKHYFPTPTANGFYTGSVENVPHIGRHDGHFAWEWGDALFVGLDPFWDSFGGGPWGRTLGRDQFDWLKATLEASDATFKFVFLHHLVGGLDNPFGGSRGGHIYAEYFEWGGRTPIDFENWTAPRGPEAAAAWQPRPRIDPETESYDFDEHREGWGVPIHQMLVDNDATIVFHGHDHVYVKEVHRDGIIYQAVAQPSRKGGPPNLEMAEHEGYDIENGVVVSSPGFLNVSVSAAEVTVEYVKTVEDCAIADCSYIADTYTIPAD
jgi:hypothetical protein